MNKLLLILSFILLSGCASSIDLMDGPLPKNISAAKKFNLTKIPDPDPAPVRGRYEQRKHHFRLMCSHYTTSSQCRKIAVDICENHDFSFEKMERSGSMCMDIIGEEAPEGWVSCIVNLKIQCTGREDL